MIGKGVVMYMCLMQGLCGFGLRVEPEKLLDDMLSRKSLLARFAYVQCDYKFIV